MQFRPSTVLALGIFALAACSDNDPTGPTIPQTANVKVIHAIGNATPVDIRFDEAAPTISGLPFGLTAPASGDGYVVVASGNRRLRVLAGGTSVIDATQMFDAGRSYTILATGRSGGTPAIAPLVLIDDNSAPTGGTIRLRIVHAAATLSNVDVYVGATGAALPTAATLTNVPFGGSAYLPPMPAGNYRVCIVLAGASTAGGCAIDLTTGAVVAGVVATAVALDPAPGAQAPGALLTVDRQP